MNEAKRRKLQQLLAGVLMVIGACGVAFGFFWILVSATRSEEQIAGWVLAGSLLPLLGGMALAAVAWVARE